jgi:hypothetical protein
MRYVYAAVLLLMTVVSTASAQERFTLTTSKAVSLVPEDVVAHLMLFDRNGDGIVAVSELSERMQPLVARGDRGGDGALDAAEIRSLTASTQQVRNLQFGGGYGFGDSLGQTSRMHIDNTIDDLRLASPANEEAKRIATAFADELEGTALANFRTALAPVLTPEQLASFEPNLKHGAGARVFEVSPANGAPLQRFVIRGGPGIVSPRSNFNVEQMRAVAAAASRFEKDVQLDDARRATLVDRLAGVLTNEERDDFRAALARRPLVKQAGIAGFAGQLQVMTQELKLRSVVNAPDQVR